MLAGLVELVTLHKGRTAFRYVSRFVGGASALSVVHVGKLAAAPTVTLGASSETIRATFAATTAEFVHVLDPDRRRSAHSLAPACKRTSMGCRGRHGRDTTYFSLTPLCVMPSRSSPAPRTLSRSSTAMAPREAWHPPVRPEGDDRHAAVTALTRRGKKERLVGEAASRTRFGAHPALSRNVRVSLVRQAATSD
jgi:hypothetical protein